MAQTDMEKLLSPHDEHKENADAWELYRRSYVGGREYEEGEYLVQHPLETRGAYNARVKQAVFVNYCAPVVDIYTAYLFRERPSRELVGFSGTPFQQFLANADFAGRSYNKLLRELSRWAGVYGHMGVIVDKPVSNEARSRADELSLGIRPYISFYRPSNIINWGWEINYNGPPVLSFLVLQEPELEEKAEVYRVWYRDRWELYKKVAKASGQPPEIVLLDSGENPLGEIPFVLLRNRDCLDRMIGVSDLTDIAPVNKRIYLYDSSAMEIIDRTAFPFLEAPMDTTRGANTEDVAIGTSNVLERDVMDAVGHRWIEPSHASLQRILEWRTQAQTDIREMAKFGEAQRGVRQGAAAFSGAALDIKFQQLSAILSDKAENMEHAEQSILRLVGMWENLDGTAEVHYPRKFGIRDAVTDLDQALRTKDIINSPVYDTLTQKSLARRTLSDMGYTADEIAQAEADIDQQPYIPSATQFKMASGMNGMSVVQTTTADQEARISAATNNPDTSTDAQQ